MTLAGSARGFTYTILGLGAGHTGFWAGLKESLPNPAHGLEPTTRLRRPLPLANEIVAH